jgi:hypothetical protein
LQGARAKDIKEMRLENAETEQWFKNVSQEDIKEDFIEAIKEELVRAKMERLVDDRELKEGTVFNMKKK